MYKGAGYRLFTQSAIYRGLTKSGQSTTANVYYDGSIKNRGTCILCIIVYTTYMYVYV